VYGVAAFSAAMSDEGGTRHFSCRLVVSLNNADY
jgi:hypothetical protein